MGGKGSGRAGFSLSGRRKHCTECDVWMNTSRVKCPDCGESLRWRPHNYKLRKWAGKREPSMIRTLD